MIATPMIRLPPEAFPTTLLYKFYVLEQLFPEELRIDRHENLPEE
jgi:hypothetical protein